MNDSEYARNHIAITDKKDKIKITCNCGRTDIVNTSVFINNNCTHKCSANHEADSWFNETVVFNPYNAYWRILLYSPPVNQLMNLKERREQVIKQIEDF